MPRGSPSVGELELMWDCRLPAREPVAGGCADPRELVLDDLRNGYVTDAVARAVYGLSGN